MALDTHPRPSLTVDPVVLFVRDSKLHVQLWRRTREPNLGEWAFPGVFLRERETLQAAVRRGVTEKLNLEPGDLHQYFAWTSDGRDARGWVVTIVYLVFQRAGVGAALADADDENITTGTFVVDGGATGPVVVRDSGGHTVPLAFDHIAILGECLDRLREELPFTPRALDFLETEFTLRAAQDVFTAISGTQVNSDSFRRNIVKTRGLVERTGSFEQSVSHRPAELYKRAAAARS